MQATKKKPVEDYYESGFKKKMHRQKYNLKLNERLKAARNRTGLSAAKVVKMMKKQGTSIGHSTLQGYEADENSLNHRYPSLPTLLELADFYECSLDYLFGLTDRFKIQQLTAREVEIKDLLESKAIISYKGIKLDRNQKKHVSEALDKLLPQILPNKK